MGEKIRFYLFPSGVAPKMLAECDQLLGQRKLPVDWGRRLWGAQLVGWILPSFLPLDCEYQRHRNTDRGPGRNERPRASAAFGVHWVPGAVAEVPLRGPIVVYDQRYGRREYTKL